MQSALIPFSKTYLNQHTSSPVTQLLSEVGLLDCSSFPTVAQLNNAINRFQCNWNGPSFKGQSTFSPDEKRYYETIISEDNVVPTREDSWHDLFNALIWLQFPKTKQLLNTLHIEDIKAVGANPRTPRRNRITHFDECGVVLAVEFKGDRKGELNRENAAKSNINISKWLDDLAHHNWQSVFVEHRTVWHQCVTPFVFGHANLEMMLNPFIGLTGKWLAVAVPEGFHEQSPWQQRAILDDAMVDRINKLGCFQHSPLLKPLPLLGVPHWYDNQTSEFYQNTEYFRPLRENAKATIQLPL
ncbi:hypothetical protein KUL42_10350 [Alteromonas sp. KUL42]|uniref:DUF3025 domain-containing protein n=1 Tax=Alteromonas sp. KUL42 TaxID=2480797 RepID=UPI0010363027|nr:DUF3025 domain-containing protein [Alteromonas sp. KUL42]TAP37816.1 DUF3025 domain-containing protein [Alteromonas sp. KUL42]GEA06274.1 hypothetical protein KUL42_10350 [Alteromonas sp. KUL42]